MKKIFFLFFVLLFVNVFSQSCGNNVCDSGENYLSCRADCASGQEDNYCDKVIDFRCDLDCNPRTLDSDCSNPRVLEQGNAPLQASSDEAFIEIPSIEFSEESLQIASLIAGLVLIALIVLMLYSKFFAS
ncbi:MAG TPA: hypothetical protein VJK05_04215 [archaeon]|nr:hypothetical protein [archaeon]